MFTDNLQGVSGTIGLHLFHAFKLWMRYESWLNRILAAWLEYRPGTFVDVGAHIGEIVHKVKSVSPETPCIAFEPQPESFIAARKLMDLSQLKDCDLLPLGLSSAPGVRPIFTRDSATDSAASLVEGFRESSFYSRRQWVAVMDGDTALRKIGAGPVSLIKVDVEGGELEVLVGLQKTLEANRPAVICEILPAYDEEGQVGALRSSRQGAIQELASREKYQLARIQRNGNLEVLEELETHSDLSLCEYFFVPREDRTFLQAFAT